MEVKIVKLAGVDLAEVEEILRYWFFEYQLTRGLPIDNDEFDEYILLMKKSLKDNSGVFFWTIKNKEKILGVFGFNYGIQEEIKKFGFSDRSIQFRLLFVNKDYLRRKLGTRLVNHVLDQAKKMGIINGFFFSHERFDRTGWPFHDQRREFKYLGDCVKHNQNCRIYKVTL